MIPEFVSRTASTQELEPGTSATGLSASSSNQAYASDRISNSTGSDDRVANRLNSRVVAHHGIAGKYDCPLVDGHRARADIANRVGSYWREQFAVDQSARLV